MESVVRSRPTRRTSPTVQDAVAHNDGFGVHWAARRAFWADGPTHGEKLRTKLLSRAKTKTRHIGDDPNVDLRSGSLDGQIRISECAGQSRIQSDFFATTVPTWMLTRSGRHGLKAQPRLLVIWRTIARSLRASRSVTQRRTRCGGPPA